MPRIRLIALDLDGTLLGSDRQMSRENVEALMRATEEGVIVCLASGRAPSTILPFKESFGLRGPVVSCNGAFVMDEDGSEIHHTCLPDSAKKILIDLAEAEGIHTNLYSRSLVHFSSRGDFANTYMQRTGLKNPEWTNHTGMRGLDATKVLFMDHPERISAINEQLQASLPTTEANIVLSEADYIEFLSPGVHKGGGLQALADSLGIAAEETAAIGDYLNDLEMVEWAGFGAAVGNARDEVKEAAKEVFPSNDEHGAAVFVDHILSLNRSTPVA